IATAMTMRLWKRSFAGISAARSTAIRNIASGAHCATSARTIGVSKRKTLPPCGPKARNPFRTFETGSLRSWPGWESAPTPACRI
ncbi:hypothetical protein LTR94_032289, partial [Friedmanniomyces endolithicus]